jgi:type I restriction enzyme S subunit
LDPSAEGFYEIPTSWAWVKLADLRPDFQNGLASRGESAGTKAVVLRLADITNGKIALRNARSLPITDAWRAKYSATDSDILVIRVNGSSSLVGQFVPCNVRGLVYCDHFIRMRVRPDVADQHFLSLLGSSPLVRRQIEKAFVSTAGQKTVNQRHISSVVMPLPPRAEQDRIVAAVEEAFPRIDAGVAGLEATRRRLDKMRDAIRFAATRGQLVPQDPGDEPAASLIARVSSVHELSGSLASKRGTRRGCADPLQHTIGC